VLDLCGLGDSMGNDVAQTKTGKPVVRSSSEDLSSPLFMVK
jgi:hypothetical protein